MPRHYIIDMGFIALLKDGLGNKRFFDRPRAVIAFVPAAGRYCFCKHVVGAYQGFNTGRKPYGTTCLFFRSHYSLIRMAQVLAIVDGEACWGELRVGDTITRVNSEPVVGKSPDILQLFESPCTSLEKVVLQIDRPCRGMIHLEHMLVAFAK
jgi:hypothetical protein